MRTANGPERAPLRIGVTGHRFLAETEKIERGIEDALDRVAAAYPGRPLLILSSLAEGADRLVARAVLRRPSGRLVVPLPLPVEEYETDFAAPESRAEFRSLLAAAAEVIDAPVVSTREAGYEAAGHAVVDGCDVLLAVWDGQGAQGQGGTGEIVARARAQGKPVVVVRAGNRKPGTREPITLGDEQGRVVVERLPEPE